MPDLPAGWRVSNSSGSFRGPSPPDDEDLEIQDDLDGLDVRPDSPGWEDVNPEDDAEELNVKCLLCTKAFTTVNSMLEHCGGDHQLHVLDIRKKFDLDFYNTIKMVNYIRTQVAAGNPNPDVGNPELWADDKFLQPALEDDALLFSLDEVLGEAETGDSDEKEQGRGHQVAASRAVFG